MASYEAADTELLLAEAGRFCLEALALKKDRPTSSGAIGVRFNLALTMVCSKRFGLALSEYTGTLRMAGEKQPRVQRGLVGRARTDLEEALDAWPQLKDVSHAKKTLEGLQSGYAEAQERVAAASDALAKT